MSLFTAIRPATRTSPERFQQGAGSAVTLTPLVDVFENAHEILLSADVPGATREGVDVHLDNGQLTLSARRPAAGDGEQAYDYHRVFTVPTGIDATKIDAELRAGVLQVRLPKAEGLRPRKIEVKAG